MLLIFHEDLKESIRESDVERLVEVFYFLFIFKLMI